MTMAQMISLVCFTLLPVFAFIAIKDGMRTMFRVLGLVLAVFAYVTICALGVMRFVS